MLKLRLGDEEALFAELAKQYSSEEEPAVAALVRQMALLHFHTWHPIYEATANREDETPL